MEEWRVVDFAPNYEVSNLGRVRQSGRSFSRLNPRKSSVVQTVTIKPKVLKGYVRLRQGKPVCLLFSIRAEGKTYMTRAHRLVLTAFVGPCPDGMEGCHYNGDPLDNRLENLRWDTHDANIQDMHGRFSPPPTFYGENHPTTKITAEDVSWIRSIKKWPRGKFKEVAQRLGIHPMTVSRIAKGRSWIALTDNG